jgi:ubiquitin-like-conjugating enzyme ATG3
MSFHGLMTTFRSLRERLTPVLSGSALDRGMLTPSEFVAAGDALVAGSPSWVWQGGDSALQRHYLPAAKQFLVTRGVPCARRVGDAAVEDAAAAAAAAVACDGAGAGEADAGGHRAAGGAAAPAPADYDDVGAAVAALRLSPGPGRRGSVGGGGDAAGPSASPVAEAGGFDIASLEDPAVAAVVDPAAAAVAAARPPPALVHVPPPAAGGSAAAGAAPSPPHDPAAHPTHQLRRYDVYVTYDNYYRTPRVFLAGVDGASGARLPPGAMLEDVATDYANTTATVEAHPQHPTAGPVLSVHPCRHAAAMRALLAGVGLLPPEGAAAAAAEGSGAPPPPPQPVPDEAAVVDAYLPLFLKLLGTMLPTLEYDFTGGELGGGSGGGGGRGKPAA